MQNTLKPKINSWAIFQEFLGILWRYKRLMAPPLIMTFILQILWIAPRVIFPLIILHLEIVDDTVVGLLMFALLANNYISFRWEMATAKVRVRLIRAEMNHKYIMECLIPIANLRYQFFVSFPAPRAVGRLDDADNIVDLIEWMIENLIAHLMAVVITFVPLALVMPPMIVFTLVVFFFFIRLTILMIKHQEKDRLLLREAYEVRRSLLSDTIEANTTLEINGALERKIAEVDTYGKTVKNPRQEKEASHWLERYGAQREQLMQFSNTVSIALLVASYKWPAVCLLLTGSPEMSLPSMLLINSLVSPMLSSLWQISSVVVSYIPTSMRLYSLILLMKTEPAYPEPQDPQPLPQSVIRIEARNLRFNYDEDKYKHILTLVPGEDDDDEALPKNGSREKFGPFNFVFEPGKTYAVVGSTGSGKTTLFNMLAALLKPTGGELLINGVDITQLNRKQLREAIGVVTQDTQVFRASVLENVRMWDESITREQVQEALRIAQLDKDLTLDRIVGERGLKLSGGQRQRLTIARAVLRPRLAILFDEATSSLDSMTEEEILKALENKYAEGQRPTVIAIAHRFSTILKSDMILVMEKGTIVEQGTHAELMAQRGKYYGMARLQGLH